MSERLLKKLGALERELQGSRREAGIFKDIQETSQEQDLNFQDPRDQKSIRRYWRSLAAAIHEEQLFSFPTSANFSPTELTKIPVCEI